jgi:hypothetical protein
MTKRVKELTTFLNKDPECRNPYFIIIDDHQKSKKRKTKTIVICVADRKVFIDSYRNLPNDDPETNLQPTGHSHGHLHLNTWREDKLVDMVKQIPSFENVDFDLKTSPNLIFYNKNDKHDFISFVTRAEQIENPIMDFLFTSSQKSEGYGIYSINITIIIYETKLHHCLLEYKIKFMEENGKFKNFVNAELIGDSLIIF